MAAAPVGAGAGAAGAPGADGGAGVDAGGSTGGGATGGGGTGGGAAGGGGEGGGGGGDTPSGTGGPAAAGASPPPPHPTVPSRADRTKVRREAKPGGRGGSAMEMREVGASGSIGRPCRPYGGGPTRSHSFHIDPAPSPGERGDASVCIDAPVRHAKRASRPPLPLVADDDQLPLAIAEIVPDSVGVHACVVCRINRIGHRAFRTCPTTPSSDGPSWPVH